MLLFCSTTDTPMYIWYIVLSCNINKRQEQGDLKARTMLLLQQDSTRLLCLGMSIPIIILRSVVVWHLFRHGGAVETVRSPLDFVFQLAINIGHQPPPRWIQSFRYLSLMQVVWGYGVQRWVSLGLRYDLNENL